MRAKKSAPEIKLPDGEHIIYNVPYVSQLLNENNCLEAGFEDPEEAKEWSQKICGLACLLMVIAKNCPGKKVNLKELLDKGREIDAYLPPTGWKHEGLVKLAKIYGIEGGRENIGRKIDKIGQHIIQQRIVIPSVCYGFKLQKNNQSRRGHLVAVFGVRITDGKVKTFILHHPAPERKNELPDLEIDRDHFKKSFSGNIIYFKTSNNGPYRV
jgi:hypothetical protein